MTGELSYATERRELSIADISEMIATLLNILNAFVELQTSKALTDERKKELFLTIDQELEKAGLSNATVDTLGMLINIVDMLQKDQISQEEAQTAIAAITNVPVVTVNCDV